MFEDPHCFAIAFQVDVSGEDDDLAIRCEFKGLLGEFQPGHLRHLQIYDWEIRMVLLEAREPFRLGGYAGYDLAVAGQ